ncbi:hypothetical protein K503DRAFT_68932 [Rhizopogon vinicolor AM-OR11-026]|uniref:Uncharacterized protein n=1 Tax=Rhizopogon vinicolor AM-OR11-026 TaxID=1314800 RepID=A0A1B7NFV0_9AGAM|nr:hypothetical protein K503DRAFT_68932 [Rhizopogon vinicolor AM-OR11-026]
MKPVQFACLAIVAAVGMANALESQFPCTWTLCLTECKQTSAEANCASNHDYPFTYQKSNDCYTCCGCIDSTS